MIAPFIGFLTGLALAAPPVHFAGMLAHAGMPTHAGLPTHAGMLAPAHGTEIAVPSVPEVPFYSQMSDIDWPSWRGKACGVASVAMLIDFYRGSGTVSPQGLLEEGIASGFYLENAGWTHEGLARLAERRGLEGEPYDLSYLNMDAAFERLAGILQDGPVIASVYSRFNPKSTIPHLAVINGIEGGMVYYNDPLEEAGGGTISIEAFKRGWKKRLIVIRPPRP